MRRYWIAIVGLAVVFFGVAAHAMEQFTVQSDGGGLCWVCRLLLQ